MAHPLDVVDAVLQAHDDGAGAQQRRDLPGRGVGVTRLHAEEHDVGIADRFRTGVGVDAHAVLHTDTVEQQSVAADRVHVRGAPDQCDRRARFGQLRAEIAADGAGAEDDGTRPGGVLHVGMNGDREEESKRVSSPARARPAAAPGEMR